MTRKHWNILTTAGYGMHVWGTSHTLPSRNYPYHEFWVEDKLIVRVPSNMVKRVIESVEVASEQ